MFALGRSPNMMMTGFDANHGPPLACSLLFGFCTCNKMAKLSSRLCADRRHAMKARKATTPTPSLTESRIVIQVALPLLLRLLRLICLLSLLEQYNSARYTRYLVLDPHLAVADLPSPLPSFGPPCKARFLAACFVLLCFVLAELLRFFQSFGVCTCTSCTLLEIAITYGHYEQPAGYVQPYQITFIPPANSVILSVTQATLHKHQITPSNAVKYAIC
ncbi:hypothetical protein V8C34DRAFT_281731 [Trichoderma compactum]